MGCGCNNKNKTVTNTSKLVATNRLVNNTTNTVNSNTPKPVNNIPKPVNNIPNTVNPNTSKQVNTPNTLVTGRSNYINYYQPKHNNKKPVANKISQMYKSFSALPQSELKSWDRIHKMAAAAETDDQKQEFEKYIEYLSHNFPCPKCRPHIKQQLRDYPIENYYTVTENGKNIGLAKWSWEFHNRVNTRLSKPVVSWDDFKKTYNI